ncbi:MAG: iron (metal) dependent repressor, dtxr family protein [Bacteroidetes bacterium HGW-Bacteroidetes-13]|nr:MAG: iron (metal) dependent repressor, dtxr family protein [Bacteroidetes bacterium HGW-Bacteroidetes-13]
MASPTVENYLKALFLLSVEKGEVNITELSNLLQVKLPTANSMIKSLHEQGWVSYEKYKPLTLTPKGKKKAALIVRKHRLTEMYLVEKMGFGWEEVHEIAEQVEHIDSTIFFERMDELLGNPNVDPHGSPIPDKNGDMQQKVYDPLGVCLPGDTVKLVALVHSSSEFLKFLNRRELQLGAKLKIESIEDYDKSMVVSYENHSFETFSKDVCDALLVERLG